VGNILISARCERPGGGEHLGRGGRPVRIPCIAWRLRPTPTDNSGGSGVDTLTHSASGAPPIAPTTVPAAAPPAIVTSTAPGVTRLTYAAKDRAGNQEQSRSETVPVGPSDRPPFGGALPTPGSFTIPAPGSVTVTATAIGERTFPFTTTISY
jgi:hypothetical protein